MEMQTTAPRRRKRRNGPRRLLIVLLCLLVVLLAVRRWDNRAPAELRLYAASRGYSVSDYPAELIDLYDRNPETRDFVFDYPADKGTPLPAALDPADLSGGVPLLLQWDPRWGYGSYSGDFFALTGCGPTCLSMAAVYLTGDSTMTPGWMGSWATDHGYAVPGSGTAWALFSEGAQALGLTSEELILDEGTIRAQLDSGAVVVCIMGPGDFTTTGHFIVLTGWEDGGFLVNDPNSRKNSGKLWTFATLQPQIENLWALRA